MQLMKQNGIQVNNNNNNGVNSRTQLSERGAAPQCPERRLSVGGELQTHTDSALCQCDSKNSFITGMIVFKEGNFQPHQIYTHCIFPLIRCRGFILDSFVYFCSAE